MNENIELAKLIPMLLPLIVLHYTLVVIALIDLVKRKKVRFNNKILWGFIIVLVNLFGPVIYFIARGDAE